LDGKKIFPKFESKPNITISSKNLIGESSINLKHLTELKDIEEVNDYMSEEEKNKIYEDNKRNGEENLKKIQFNYLSFRLGECVSISELFECYQFAKTKMISLNKQKVGFSLWDNGVENDHTFIVDIGIGLKANMIILHGINNKNERVNKINRNIDLIEESS